MSPRSRRRQVNARAIILTAVLCIYALIYAVAVIYRVEVSDWLASKLPT